MECREDNVRQMDRIIALRRELDESAASFVSERFDSSS
jgi:hypothetical protein